MNAEDIKRKFEYKNLLKINNVIKNENSALRLEISTLRKHQEGIIRKEVKQRTKEIEKEYKEELKEKDKQIESLKKELAKMASIMNNDSTNSGIPTSKTPLNKKKYIPNTREKTNKLVGGQKGHKVHKLKAFKENEATEIIEIIPEECPHCGSKEIIELETSKDKCETDYEVKLIKKLYKFKECRCKNCNKEFHKNIPNNLKEENQYGNTVQALSVCLTNEIFTPYNKTVKLIKGITDNEINLSEGYVVKLQKKASELLKPFIKELEDYIVKEPVYGWDEGIIYVDTKQEVLRTYCTDKVALFYARDSKSKNSVDEDDILKRTGKETVVMHDHNLISYHEDYKFENVECFIHLNRRLEKMYNNTKHEYLVEMKKYISKINNERNEAIKRGEESFSKEYIENVHKIYKEYIKEGKRINELKDYTKNYFKDEELTLLIDLLKYENNYLKWVDRFDIPSTNNGSERSIRPIKSKMKISGQFKNLTNAEYYATIRSYIETCKRNGLNVLLACESLMQGDPLTVEEILKYGKRTER